MVLGLGIGLLMVFPNEVISQTTDSNEFQSPSIEYIEATPEVIVQAEVLYNAQHAKTNFCSCVSFVKGITGYDEPVGKAKNWPRNSALPQIGGAVITNESPYGHIAYITAIVGNSMTVVEANWIPCKKSTRTMAIDDPRILGFWINN